MEWYLLKIADTGPQRILTGLSIAKTNAHQMLTYGAAGNTIIGSFFFYNTLSAERLLNFFNNDFWNVIENLLINVRHLVRWCIRVGWSYSEVAQYIVSLK